MEEVILRFSHLGEKIFAQLDNLSLARCREVSSIWKTFLDQQKFLHIRRIQSYIEKKLKMFGIIKKKQKYEFGEPWKKFFKKSNTEMIILLNSAVKACPKNILLGKKLVSYPLHYLVIGNISEKDETEDLYGFTEKK